MCALGAFAFGAAAYPVEPPDPPNPEHRCDAVVDPSDWAECMAAGPQDSGDYGQFPSDYTGGGSSQSKKPPTLCETYQRYAESTGEGDGSHGGGAAAFGVAIMVTIACIGEMSWTFSLPAWR